MLIKINNSYVTTGYVGDLDLGKCPNLFISTTGEAVKIKGTLYKKAAQIKTKLPDSDITWKPGDSLNDYFRQRVAARKELVDKISHLKKLKEGLENGEVTYGLNKNLIEQLGEAVDSQQSNVPFMVMGGHVAFDDIRKSQDALPLESEWNSLVNTIRSDYYEPISTYGTELLNTFSPFTDTTLKSPTGALVPGGLAVGCKSQSPVELGLRIYSVQDDGELLLRENIFDTHTVFDLQVYPTADGKMVVIAYGTDGVGDSVVFGAYCDGDNNETFSKQIDDITSVSAHVTTDSITAFVITSVSESFSEVLVYNWDSTGTENGDFGVSSYGFGYPFIQKILIEDGQMLVVSADYIEQFTVEVEGNDLTITQVAHDSLPIEIQGLEVVTASLSNGVANFILTGGNDIFSQTLHVNPLLWSTSVPVFELFDDNVTSVDYIGSTNGATLLFKTNVGITELDNVLEPYVVGEFPFVGLGYAPYITNSKKQLLEMTGSVRNLYDIRRNVTSVDSWNFEDVVVDINTQLIGGQHPLIGVTPPDTIDVSKLQTSLTQTPFLKMFTVEDHLIGQGESAVEIRGIERGLTEKQFFFDFNSSEIDPVLSNTLTSLLDNAKRWFSTVNLPNTFNWEGTTPGDGTFIPGTYQVVDEPDFDGISLKVEALDATAPYVRFEPGVWQSQDLGRYYRVNFEYSCNHKLLVNFGGETFEFEPETEKDPVWVIPIDHVAGEVSVNVYNMVLIPIDDSNSHTQVNVLSAETFWKQNEIFSSNYCSAVEYQNEIFPSSVTRDVFLTLDKLGMARMNPDTEGTAYIVLRDYVPDEDESAPYVEPVTWEGATLSVKGLAAEVKLEDLPKDLLGLTLDGCTNSVGTLADIADLKHIRIQ
jgi:hypothetical protein